MKKITAILLGTLIASSAALAQTNQVLSKNAVGYVKRTIPAGGLDLLTVPFVNLSEPNNTVSNVFNAASNLTTVSFWDTSSQTYKTYLKSKGSWGASGTNVIKRGQGLFFRSPAGVAQQLFMMGEVPDSTSAPSTTVSVVEGVNVIGSAYPAAMSWTNTTLATSLPNLTTISTWNGSNYVTLLKSKGSWGAAGNSLVIEPGSAFFVRQPASSPTVNWNQNKPYTWP